MNREIKFRGKRIDNGEWVYGDLLQPTEICDIYEIANCESIDGTRYEVIPESIGQFTGLYDKNGKEIYEGDIITNGDKNIKYIVEWCDTGLKARQYNNRSYIGLKYWKDVLEVIGNIYDNFVIIDQCL